VACHVWWVQTGLCSLTSVSTLFFMWGFARGVIYAFNGQIQTLLGYSSAEIVALNTAYWGAYFFGPLLVGYWVLKYEGFKATFITGLCIYAVGAMAFWPSAVLRSYPGFFVSNFIIPFGLSCLEIAANPFIALAGPGELSEARLNFAQGIQGIGGIISPLITNSALLSGLDYQDLFRLQWCYLGVAFFVTLLALVFFYVPLSEAEDQDLESMARQRLENAHLDPECKVFGLGARSLILWTGVFAMFVYLGAQQGINNYWNPLVGDTKPGSPQLQTYLISRGVFTFGRFLGAGLAYIGVPPRVFLAVYTVGGFVCSILALLLPQGSAALSMLILVVFFTSTMFPTLYSMTLRGQGRHTKFAAAAVTMAISGGAVGPAAIYAIGLYHPNTSRYPLLVASVLLGGLMFWPMVMSSKRTLRRWVDPVWSKSTSSITASGGDACNA
jgi:fucose permease